MTRTITIQGKNTVQNKTKKMMPQRKIQNRGKEYAVVTTKKPLIRKSV